MKFTQDTSWSTEPTKDGDVKVMCGSMTVAIVPHSPGMFRPEARANAELIRRAPDMYQALGVAVEAMHVMAYELSDDNLNQVNAILRNCKNILEGIT